MSKSKFSQLVVMALATMVSAAPTGPAAENLGLAQRDDCPGGNETDCYTRLTRVCPAECLMQSGTSATICANACFARAQNYCSSKVYLESLLSGTFYLKHNRVIKDPRGSN
jgi:hypothetical protein